MIHPSAVISPEAQLDEDVKIGPHCVIEGGVTIAKGTHLHSHVVIHGTTDIGENNEFFPFSAIGIKTQDLKYAGEPTALIIGNQNVFRENTTVHRGTISDTPTRIGDHNLFLAYSHVAHDCQLGSHNILSNAAMLAGHVHIEDHVIISGMSGAHQFVHIGSHAMIGGLTKIVQDVPPFLIVDGNPATVRGLNQVGLQRRGFSPEDLSALKKAYRKLFLKKETNMSENLTALAQEDATQNSHVQKLIHFIQQSERGVHR